MLLLYTSTPRGLQPGKMLYPRAATFELQGSDTGSSPNAQKNVVLLKPSILGDPDSQHITSSSRHRCPTKHPRDDSHQQEYSLPEGLKALTAWQAAPVNLIPG